jgi:methylated-DNA-[protein]-cysteine S-methyltransferase
VPESLGDERGLVERIVIPTPFGAALEIASADGRIVASAFVRRRGAIPRARAGDRILGEAAAQVKAYLAKRLRRFDLPLHFCGTEMQIAIWRTVASLESGDLVSYADIARAIGAPGAHRAVASAMKSAPLDLFVPAHRVIGADGRLHGAAAGSMRRKLLTFEGHRTLAKR